MQNHLIVLETETGPVFALLSEIYNVERPGDGRTIVTLAGARTVEVKSAADRGES